MAIVTRGQFRKGSNPSMPIELYPSEHAPANFSAKDRVRRRQAKRVAPVDAEHDFGECEQCGFPQSLSEEKTCPNCGSDNRLNRRL